MGPPSTAAPATWLTGRALDVACGAGRHARWLASRGYDTRAIDRDVARVQALSAEAIRAGLVLRAEVHDLEDGSFVLPPRAYDLIVVVHYLHRPLVPSLRAALANGGVLVYETFTRAQALRGRPVNPNFLLEPGELLALVDGLDVLAHREGDFEGRMVAGVVARQPTG